MPDLLDGEACSEATPPGAAKIQGERLRALLNRLGRKQVWLLNELQLRGEMLDRPKLSRYVTGKTIVSSAARRAAIADALGASILDIWPHLSGSGNAYIEDFSFDGTDMGFHRIRSWVPEFRLRETNVAQPLECRQEAQDWVDPEHLSRLIDDESQYGGDPCPTLVRWQLDNGESEYSSIFRMWVSRSDYVRHRAIKRALETDPAVLARLKDRIAEVGLSRVMENSPRSNICCNVTVRARDGALLFLQRPEETRTHPNSWQIGPHETMNWRAHVAPGSAGKRTGSSELEHPFDLVRRALKEEIGLDRADYDEPLVSWFGVYLPEVSGYFFAHVSSNLSRSQIALKLRNAESSWETRQIAWLDELTEEDVAAALSILGVGPNHIGGSGPLNVTTKKGASEITKLLPHTAMSLTELWRVRRRASWK